MKKKILLSIVLMVLVISGLTFTTSAAERVWLVFDMGARPDLLGQAKPDRDMADPDGWIYRVDIGPSEEQLDELCSFHFDVMLVGVVIRGYVFEEETYRESVWLSAAVDITEYVNGEFILRLLTFPGKNNFFDWGLWGAPRLIKGELPALDEAKATDDIPIDVHDLPSGVVEIAHLGTEELFNASQQTIIVEGEATDYSLQDWMVSLWEGEIQGLTLKSIWASTPWAELVEREEEGGDIATCLQWKLKVTGEDVTIVK